MNLSQEYLQSIKPKKRCVSDKYDWNIYRFFKENGLNDIHVFKSLKANNFYFIYGDRLNGSIGINVWSVLHAGSYGKLELGSYILFNFKDQSVYEEITDKFFKHYKKLGRCYFDPSHNAWWRNEDERFTVINKNSKRCNWCGHFLHREVNKIITIQRKEVWKLDK